VMDRFDVAFELVAVDTDPDGKTVWDAEVDVRGPVLRVGATAAAVVAGSELDALLVAMRRALDKVVAGGGRLPVKNDLSPWVANIDPAQPQASIQRREQAMTDETDPLTVTDLWRALGAHNGVRPLTTEQELTRYAVQAALNEPGYATEWREQAERLIRADRDQRRGAQ